eukprot:gene18617-20494_t
MVQTMSISIAFVIATLSCLSIADAGVPRMCAQNVIAFRKCEILKRFGGGKIDCVFGEGEKDCYEKIANGFADLSTFDGGSIYHAGKEHKLKVIMSERLRSLAASGKKYFGVAVVKATSSLTFNSLKGARSCHTGVQKSSGWIIPVGTLLDEQMMTCRGGDQYSAVARFFSGSCAPGANDPKYNPRLHCVKKLCSQCAGAGNAKCSRSRIEPYYGYQGAFQCLKDGKGDVAFIKQSILTSLSSEEQAKYKLLCRDNTVKDPKDFASCNLAAAPAHAVLTRSDATEEEISQYQALLKVAVRKYGKRSGGPVNIFDGSIFSRSAVGLDVVPQSARAYDSYLDKGYVAAVAQLEACSTGSVSSQTC